MAALHPLSEYIFNWSIARSFVHPGLSRLANILKPLRSLETACPLEGPRLQLLNVLLEHPFRMMGTSHTDDSATSRGADWRLLPG